MILQDALSCGIPWAESRKLVYRNAPESCRDMFSEDGQFSEIEPFTPVEMDALKDLPSLVSIMTEPENYVTGIKSGARLGDARLSWHAGLIETSSSAEFLWLDLRELQIKIMYQNTFRGLPQMDERSKDQISEVFRYYNRALHTFRRLKFIRWTKIAVRDGRARIFIYNEQSPYPNQRAQLLLERSFFSNRPADCELLNEEIWQDAWPHVRKRMEFWRLEEGGELTDDYLDEAIRSDDKVLAAWAGGYMRRAGDPLVVERIREQIVGSPAEEARAAIRAAGRLWLNELENDVMAQYNRHGNSVGPAVADYIGAIGLTGRTFLPKILRTMTRRGDLATIMTAVAAMRSFPHTAEAKALPESLELLLRLSGDTESVVDKFPGIASDLYTTKEPRRSARPLTLEILRASAAGAIIETTAQSADEQTFAAVTSLIPFDSQLLDKLLEEIETSIRTDASTYLLGLLRAAVDTSKKWAANLPVTRRMVIISRTLMRVNKPEDRFPLLVEALPFLAAHVGSFHKDCKLEFCFHVDNLPMEPLISLRTILKGLPDEADIVDQLISRGGFSDKEKFLVSEMAVDRQGF